MSLAGKNRLYCKWEQTLSFQSDNQTQYPNAATMEVSKAWPWSTSTTLSRQADWRQRGDPRSAHRQGDTRVGGMGSGRVARRGKTAPLRWREGTGHRWEATSGHPFISLRPFNCHKGESVHEDFTGEIRTRICSDLWGPWSLQRAESWWIKPAALVS